MAHKGLAKLAEELGELQQVVGKLLASPEGDHPEGDHPDGGPPLLQRFEEEAGDVLAAIAFSSEKIGAVDEAIFKRADIKFGLFKKWDVTNG